MLTADFIRVTVPAGTSSGKTSVTHAGGPATKAKSFMVQQANRPILGDAFSNRHTRPTQRMIKEMPNIKELLSGLRQEISDLQSMNARYAGKRVHSEVEQTALELRTTRLREIKQELSKMLDRPQDAKVWWEKSRRSSGVAIAE